MNPALFVNTLREKKLLLPPLSGYTDYPYRMILAGFHPPFLMTEMANARAIIQGNQRTSQILKITTGDHYDGVQLVGSIPEYMAKAAHIVETLGFDYIDINMGCTARKVACRGEGISLMKQEKRACEIVAAVASSVNVPVTCKLRLGTSKSFVNVVSLSQRLVDAGAVALTIHGRSGEKKFGVPVNLNVIKEVAHALPVPVIANGGVYSGRDAKHVLQMTGVAAVMPGRGLIGNPWIIPEIRASLSASAFSPPTLQERQDICTKHLRLLVEFYGERRGVLKMRSILPYYFSSCASLKTLKLDVQQVSTTEDILILLARISQKGDHLVYMKK
jgi:tRNA-dihydrouridine synthase B